jgi:hypothetical protein
VTQTCLLAEILYRPGAYSALRETKRCKTGKGNLEQFGGARNRSSLCAHDVQACSSSHGAPALGRPDMMQTANKT